MSYSDAILLSQKCLYIQLTEVGLTNQKTKIFRNYTLLIPPHPHPLLLWFILSQSLLFFFWLGEERNSLFYAYPLTKNLVLILIAKAMHSFIIFFSNGLQILECSTYNFIKKEKLFLCPVEIVLSVRELVIHVC